MSWTKEQIKRNEELENAKPLGVKVIHSQLPKLGVLKTLKRCERFYCFVSVLCIFI
jgi:hypothetical protein